MSQAKYLQETFCRGVTVRASKLRGATGRAHQVAVHQLSQDLTAIDSSDAFNFRPYHRLTIRDNGQSFQGRRRQPNFHR